MTRHSESDPQTVPNNEGERPLKVLIGADTFAPDVNGAARFASRLAAGLVDRGHEVHIVAPAASRRHGTWREVHEGRELIMHRLYSWRWYPHDWLRFALPWRINQNSARILDEVKPDVVHFQSHIVVGRGLSIEAQKRGIRIIGTNHFMPENMLEHTMIPQILQRRAIKMAWMAARRTFGRAERVTTPTRKAAEFLEKYSGLKDVLAISCGINANDYRPNMAPQDRKRVIFVGRVTGEKRIDVLLRAAVIILQKMDVDFEIVGGGDQKHALEQLAEKLGIAEHVTFTGYVTDEQLRDAYHRATVLAMPSTAELQSIVTMEAMASALPVVAADAMALPHLVHDGENGYLFTPDDEKELADKLLRILEMPHEKLVGMKEESLRLIKAHDIERTITTFERLYRGESVDDPTDSTDHTA